MKSLVLFAAAALLVAPGLASAQTAPAAQSGSTDQAVATPVALAQPKGKEARICKPILHTGSRLGSTSVCKTKKEWDDQAALYRKTLERQQLNPSKIVAQ